jgi:23S rRNA (cytidine2498-2'-O)-methyltransferase
MIALPESSFAFATCQVGAETALKDEVQRTSRALRPAFMRPGFVTFKSDAPLPSSFALDLVFARALAVSRAKGDDDEIVARAVELANTFGPLRLHVWPRERHAPGAHDTRDEGDEIDPHAAGDALAARIAGGVAPGRLLAGSIALPGELVLDIVDVDRGLWFLGTHVHGQTTSPFAGGDPRLEVPSEAPSRAWLKIEQGLRLADVPLREGDRVVEIGAAPGGVTHALLARGCDVVAIDPGEMDARVLASPRLHHVRAPVADVDPASIARPVRFLVLDVNISPFAALRQIEAMVKTHAPDLFGLLLTLKLGDWHMARRVPHLVSIVKKLGAPIAEVHAKQLPANKVEIFVAALTTPGVKRRLG